MLAVPARPREGARLEVIVHPADDAARTLRGECCSGCASSLPAQDYEGDGEFIRPRWYTACQERSFFLSIDPGSWCYRWRAK